MAKQIETAEAVRRLKAELGNRVLIPAHHYQRPEVAAIADIIGDSYKLAVETARSSAEYIVFCGVRFMAEGAAILAGPQQKIVLPVPGAGCPMADMIDLGQAERALAAIAAFSGKEAVPVIYMNAYGEIKALGGRHGGAVCTSSNAAAIITRYLAGKRPIFFAPDQCLGINTARKLGLDDEEIATVRSDGTIGPAGAQGDPERIRLYLWDGNCSVHQQFTVDQIQQARRAFPGIRIIVHPEVPEPVAAAADLAGSTEYIYHTIRDAEPGTVWGVGTDCHFIARTAAEFPDKRIYPLVESPCREMEKTTLETVLAVLEAISAGALHRTFPESLITVPDKVRKEASLAINRMIAIVEEG